MLWVGCSVTRPAPRQSDPGAAARDKPARRATSKAASKATVAQAPTRVTVKGWKLAVSLIPEKHTFMLGEPIYLTYKVQNLSAVDLLIPEGGDYRNPLGRPNRYRVVVRPKGGKPLQVVSSGFGLGGITSQRRLPADGEFSRELFLPNWARITKPGVYVITCARRLGINPTTPAGRKNFQVKGPEVIARTMVTVTPMDAKRMGRIIRELGEALASKNDKFSGKASQALAALHDRRTIVHWLKYYDTKGIKPKYRTIEALARYNDNAALEGLRRCVVASRSYIRSICARALGASPHPKAFAVLVTMKGDATVRVRLAVLHAAAKHPCGQTAKLLAEMSKHTSPAVKKAAKGYLLRCRKKGNRP